MMNDTVNHEKLLRLWEGKSKITSDLGYAYALFHYKDSTKATFALGTTISYLFEKALL